MLKLPVDDPKELPISIMVQSCQVIKQLNLMRILHLRANPKPKKEKHQHPGGKPNKKENLQNPSRKDKTKILPRKLHPNLKSKQVRLGKINCLKNQMDQLLTMLIVIMMMVTLMMMINLVAVRKMLKHLIMMMVTLIMTINLVAGMMQEKVLAAVSIIIGDVNQVVVEINPVNGDHAVIGDVNQVVVDQDPGPDHDQDHDQDHVEAEAEAEAEGEVVVEAEGEVAAEAEVTVVVVQEGAEAEGIIEEGVDQNQNHEGAEVEGEVAVEEGDVVHDHRHDIDHVPEVEAEVAVEMVDIIILGIINMIAEVKDHVIMVILVQAVTEVAEGIITMVDVMLIVVLRQKMRILIMGNQR